MTTKELSEQEKRNKFAVDLAGRDAIFNGIGFILVDEEGSLTYVDVEEAATAVKAVEMTLGIKSNR